MGYGEGMLRVTTSNVTPNCAPRRDRAGVTLVEVVVVIGVMLVLLGILAPALRGAREEAVQTVGVSNIKQNAQLVHTYADRGLQRR